MTILLVFHDTGVWFQRLSLTRLSLLSSLLPKSRLDCLYFTLSSELPCVCVLCVLV